MFQLKLVFSEEYPQKPPKVKFMQTVYHPNGMPGLIDAPSSFRFASLQQQLAQLIDPSLSLRLVFGDGSLCLDIIQDKWTPVRLASFRKALARLCESVDACWLMAVRHDHDVLTIAAAVAVVPQQVYSVASLLTSITSLFTDPNPDSPANPEAARLFVSDKKEYNKRVRACVERTLEE